MEEESEALLVVREYRRQRDSGMEAEGEEERWKEDGELLLKAVEEGDLDVVQYLVEEAGVSVEEADRKGRRPLHWAAARGRLAVGQYLVVEGGADIEAEAEDGERPLDLAALGGHEAFVEWLLEQGASVDAEDRAGRRPLHFAVAWIHPSVVRCLLQRRAGSIDVNAQDRCGRTALHLAADSSFTFGGDVEEECALELVRLLVEEGEADPLLRDRGGKRASDRAKDVGFDEVERYLLEAEEMAEMQKQA